MSLVNQASNALSAQSDSPETEQVIREDYLKKLGIVNQVFSGIFLNAAKTNVQEAVKAAEEYKLHEVDDDYIKALLVLLKQAASLNEVAANSVAGGGVAMRDPKMAEKPIKRYKTFRVPKSVFAEYRTAVKTDQYSHINRALNDEELVVLENEETGEKRGIRRKK